MHPGTYHPRGGICPSPGQSLVACLHVAGFDPVGGSPARHIQRDNTIVTQHINLPTNDRLSQAILSGDAVQSRCWQRVFRCMLVSVTVVQRPPQRLLAAPWRAHHIYLKFRLAGWYG